MESILSFTKGRVTVAVCLGLVSGILFVKIEADHKYRVTPSTANDGGVDTSAVVSPAATDAAGRTSTYVGAQQQSQSLPQKPPSSFSDLYLSVPTGVFDKKKPMPPGVQPRSVTVTDGLSVAPEKQDSFVAPDKFASTQQIQVTTPRVLGNIETAETPSLLFEKGTIELSAALITLISALITIAPGISRVFSAFVYRVRGKQSKQSTNQRIKSKTPSQVDIPDD